MKQVSNYLSIAPALHLDEEYLCKLIYCHICNQVDLEVINQVMSVEHEVTEAVSLIRMLLFFGADLGN